MTLDIEPILDQKNLKPSITVMGVGGAGGNAVNNMIQSNLNNVEFIVANTDAQALENSLCFNRIQLGLTKTQGLGAGANPDVGKEAAEESIDELNEELRNTNMIFLTAGLGGGTGTGALPVIANLAKKANIVTVAIVSTPFNFEGTQRMKLANEGLEELKKSVDTLLVIPNQNLFKVSNEQTSFADAFKKADNVLFEGVKGLTDLITQPGLINLDFADVRTVIKEMGYAMMGTAVAEGENKAMEASDLALTNPLIENVDMNTAKGVIVNISGGSDMSLMDVDHAAHNIKKSVNPDANIIFGSSNDESLVGKLKISIFATGIEESDNKRILTYPNRDNESDDSSLLNDGNINTNTVNEKPDNDNQEKIINTIDILIDESISQDGFELKPQQIEEKAKLTANYDDLQQKKKTGFFGFLNNLMTTNKKDEEFRVNSKKNKKNKAKTDPNLFLFGEDDSEKVDTKDLNTDSSNISDLNIPMSDIESEHDLDLPSYQRKGNI
ncbi:cell division protein FtsZ [Alphaproteobacteria bacterium]|nr:cell division protein FtsZ [Alphaproteobacteria bacterium]